MKKLLVLGFAAALACAAYAYPTLQGPTGLLTVPTADITAAGQFDIAGDWVSMSPFISDDSTLDLRVLYGFGDVFEVGAAFTNSENSLAANTWNLNAKYKTPFTLGGAAWAVGADYVNVDSTDVSDSDNFLEAYVSGTKEFNENFKGTASLHWSGNQLLEDIDQQWLIAIAAETKLDNGLTLIGEYTNSLPGAQVSAAARYPLTDALTGQVGYDFTTDASTIGLNYAFGMPVAAE